MHGLQALPARIEQMLSMDKERALAEGFSDKHHALFLGRGRSVSDRRKGR